MTFDDDFARFGRLNVPLKQLGLEWPPPPYIRVVSNMLPDGGLLFERESYSDITDDQRATMTRVARGALYRRVTTQ